MIQPVTGVVFDGTLPAGTIPQQKPTQQRIDLPKQEDLVVKLAVVKQDGTVQDISGWTVKLGIRKFITDTNPVVTKTVAGGSLTDPTNGKTDIVVASADTAALLQLYLYAYDIHGLDGAGKRWQLVPVSVFRIAPIAHRPGE
jgi:hypothetical protein